MPAFSGGVSFQVLKRKNQIDASTGKYFSVGKFTPHSPAMADTGSVEAKSGSN